MTNNDKRLIEVAFPLKETSLDSVHEKSVRHGHISTLHIWPARRPLAACRAALIATLLPDPGDDKKRKEILEKLAGKLVQRVERKKLPSGRIEEKVKEETEGGILHWGRESSPALDWFREEIKKAYGGRAPKVLDPFAGGGAIPLEAMRLGCEVTAIDINPVAWFILKCTLEYPQKLAGQYRPLPDCALHSPEFMEGYFKGTGKLTRRQLEKKLQSVQMEMFPAPDVDLSWHVRAWGWRVLQQARKELAEYYPTYAEWEPKKKSGKKYEAKPLRKVPLDPDGNADIDVLNADLSKDYLNDASNPRWVAKATVAYLWARTVKCKSCRATIPLLKTRWLCKKTGKRELLTMEPNPTNSGVEFGIESDVPVQGGNAAQRREHDKRTGAGTMTRSGVTCPCCKVIMTMEDVRVEGLSDQISAVLTAVVVNGQKTKEYRLPEPEEIEKAEAADARVDPVFSELPFARPTEHLPTKEALGFRVPLYGFDEWGKLFISRQLVALGTFIRLTRSLATDLLDSEYPDAWNEAIRAYLSDAIDKLADRGSTVCTWTVGWDKIRNTFARFALPITWDFAESVTIEDSSGGYLGALDWIGRYIQHASEGVSIAPPPKILKESAILAGEAIGEKSTYDLILTDPPYYDAIPYSDLMDFFYVWLRRSLQGISPEIDDAFKDTLSPKWNTDSADGELIDDSSRHEGDKNQSKKAYEEGMARVFGVCCELLKDDGRLVIVFAHKHPDAWETLVTAIIRAGFVVDGSWPIQTEMAGRTRAIGAGALSSSVWLVCKKRAVTARPGWDNNVLIEMRERITERLRAFWDAGVRGPDFVWAATGPALEAYSKHPVVKKADVPGELMSVHEFLQHVRRMVVDFVVGRVLTGNGTIDAVSGLDDVTTYYLLHRNDFKMEDAPVGACIMYALSCGLSDRALGDQFDILVSKKNSNAQADIDDDSEGDDDEGSTSSGSQVKLKPWIKRTKRSMGFEAPKGRPVPLIDQIHRLMHLWKAGDVVKVDEYLNEKALRNNNLFKQVLQTLIELSESGSNERSILESISNHVQARGERHDDAQLPLAERAEVLED